MVAIPWWPRPCQGVAPTTWEGQELHAFLLSIYGYDALEVPVALAEVEGAEPGGALAAVFMSDGMCRGLSFGISRCHRVATVVFGVVVVVSKCNC